MRDLEPRSNLELPSLADVSGQLAPQDIIPVVAYLERGTEVLDVMEATPDPTTPGRYISGGSSLLTDGEWVWRLDLSSYVRAHRVALPEAFIRKAQAAVIEGAFPSVAIDAELSRAALFAAGWV